MSDMDELMAFVHAQLDDDERVARDAAPGPWVPNAEHDEVVAVDDITVAYGFALSGNQLRATVDHIAHWDPARVLAEIDAKRRILDEHQPVHGYDRNGPVCSTCGEQETLGDEDAVVRWPCPTVRALALPHADHPDYREEWRPAPTT